MLPLHRKLGISQSWTCDSVEFDCELLILLSFSIFDCSQMMRKTLLSFILTEQLDRK